MTGDFNPFVGANMLGLQQLQLQQLDNNYGGYGGVYRQQVDEFQWAIVKQKLAQNTQWFSPLTPGFMVTGKQYVVVCGHESRTADTLDDANVVAASMAHQYQTEAYILQPISKVAPKRDVVTTPITLK